MSTSLSEAVIICTLNRPSNLRSTLQSIDSQKGAENRRGLIIDASDAAERSENQATLKKLNSAHQWSHHTYDHSPSQARQRNYGLSLLPSSIDVVHFLDDDVTLHPGYFQHLTEALHENPELGGVGGIVYEEVCPSPPDNFNLPKRLFLLDGPPGKMLSSGHAPTAQRYPPSHPPAKEPISTTFLNGCSSYRQDILSETKFDPVLEAHSLFEDLDLSFRVSKSHELSVIPQASLVHHRSTRTRQSTTTYTEEMILHRHWLVQKHNLSPIAFWWSVLGQIGARLFSSKPTKWRSLSGILQGVQRILRGHSPLLSSST